MSSLDYMKQARACQRAAELSTDPILAAQLCEERQMWIALARQSAAIDGLTALIARLDEHDEAGSPEPPADAAPWRAATT